ncbi:hypothetical protein FOZ61_001196 [Perkinsus olseni]|uniref:Uncharacterized protein n=1 Tax=Perkinsus olseni TaxID=32597 RepID=A0A7J6LXN9_PEROL|nr:hypothetical protein FOL46_006559 [Perkinsus olseni]KAF4664015.1 hypothetical protein FOZ61_001196 [Perkinsus olseni]
MGMAHHNRLKVATVSDSEVDSGDDTNEVEVDESVESVKDIRLSQRFKKEAFKVCLYIFLLEFKPPEPHLPAFLRQVKGFTEAQINNEIFPVWTYSSLVLIFISGFIAEFLGCRIVLFCGSLGRVATRLLLLFGTEVWQMQLCQACYACGSAAEVIFYGYIFHLVAKKDYQRIASYTLACHVSSHGSSGVLGDLMLNQWGLSYDVLLYVSMASLCASAVVVFFLTAVDRPKAPRPSEVKKTLKLSYGHIPYLIIIIWWIGAAACYGILYGYETSLYDVIATRDGVPNYNGTVVAISQVFGTCSALVASYKRLSNWAEKHPHLTVGVFAWFSLIAVTVMAWWEKIIPMCSSFVIYFTTYYFVNAFVQAENGRVMKDTTVENGGENLYAMLCMINNIFCYGLQALLTFIGLTLLRLRITVMYKGLWAVVATFTVIFTLWAFLYNFNRRRLRAGITVVCK